MIKGRCISTILTPIFLGTSNDGFNATNRYPVAIRFECKDGEWGNPYHIDFRPRAGVAGRIVGLSATAHTPHSRGYFDAPWVIPSFTYVSGIEHHVATIGITGGSGTTIKCHITTAACDITITYEVAGVTAHPPSTPPFDFFSDLSPDQRAVRDA